MPSKPAITLIAVGKLRESYWRDAEAEYRKRLGAYTTKLTVVEIADEPTPDDASSAQEESIRRREGERILAQIGDRDYAIALDRGGKSLDSVTFAAHLERATAQGAASRFAFIIGGSLGLHETVLTRADLTLNFGAFTYPHQLMRIILLEQLFRAGKINRGETYHK
jgi:23S rRNA (pseudouridine1915-N3)-methyltransferase